MAARNTDLTVTTGAAFALSDGAVASCRVQNISGYHVMLQATLTGTAPTSRAGALLLGPRETLAADLTLEQLFPGIGSGSLYLWAFTDIPCVVSVSHA